MGQTKVTLQPPPRGGGPPPDFSGIIDLLTKIWNTLLSVFQPGGSAPVVLKVKITTHLKFQAISITPFTVKKAIIQNPTSTDVLLIDTSNNQGIAVSVPTDGTSGFILNPSGSSGQAGGSHPMGNIDLSKVFITGTVTDGIIIPVYCEQ